MESGRQGRSKEPPLDGNQDNGGLLKLCRICNSIKSESEFFKNKAKKDGLQTSCKDCRKIQNHEHYRSSDKRRKDVRDRNEVARKKKRDLVRRYKSFCGCRVCGEKDFVVLDLHHLDPSQKEGDPSKFYMQSLKRLRDEIRKCAVLCSNCHRRVHAGTIVL